jgi:peptidoglycan/LPS O-acetylase OafA/YrhL
MSDERPKQRHRFYELDLLRFAAAFAVVLFHYGFRGFAADHLTDMPYLSIAPVAKYGYLGVDLFFLISGFVILMTAYGGSARRFVASRVARLYPAFWACCTLTFLVTLIAGGSRFSASLHQYAVNMTMLSGFLGVSPLDGAYWSLFVEMRFYLLVLAVLLARQMRRIQELLGFWLVLVLIVSHWPIPRVGFFLISDYASYFIAGAIFYIVHEEGISFYNLFILAVSYLLAVRVAVAKAAEMAARFHTRFDRTHVVAVLTVAFVALFLVATGRTRKLGSARWLSLGALTYPLYLIHQNVGFMLFNLSYPRLNPHIVMFGTLGAVLLTAYLVNRMIEKPFAGPFRTRLERWLSAGERPLMAAPSHPARREPGEGS